MPLTLGDAKKAQISIAPAGVHLARCYQVVDMGTVTQDGRYGVKTNRRIRFTWELPDVKHVFDEKKGPEPFAVSMQLTFTSGPKSNLIKMLESWRGRKFTEHELEHFEIRNVLGAACMINLIHVEAANGNTYANVDNITPVPERLRKDLPSPINPSVYYEVDMGQNETFKSFPEWMRKEILRCEEWAPKKGEPVADKKDGPPDDLIFEQEESGMAGVKKADFDSNIPF